MIIFVHKNVELSLIKILNRQVLDFLKNPLYNIVHYYFLCVVLRRFA